MDVISISDITLNPYEALPLHWFVTVIAVAVTVLTVIWLLGSIIRRRRLAVKRALISILNILAATCFALAAWNPVKIDRFDTGKLHLAVVLDVSDSVLRTKGGWSHIQDVTQTFLSNGLAGVSDDIIKQGTASIVTFRGGVLDNEFLLASLLNEFGQLTPEEFASGEGSHIGAGLQRAGELTTKAGGRGEILLVSDGHDTEGEAHNVAQQLARKGIPINVLPVESRVPELAITSANLANQVHAQSPTLLRGVIHNTGPEPINAELRIFQNPGASEDATEFVGPATNATVSYAPFPGNSYHALRQPITFEGVGIQSVDLLLVDTDNNATTHRRRFFTHVNRPINLLGIGGDFLWQQAISPDFATVTPVFANELSTDIDLNQFDGVIISEVRAMDLDQDMVNKLATAVKEDGLGLFLINGDHSGVSEDTNTILNTYRGTPIAPLLPVSTEPRPFSPEPPPRHVVIVIDASGSMDGWPLAKARDISKYIVHKYLRSQDHLDLIAFNTTARHLVDNQAMDAAGARFAIQKLDGIAAGGGTDPKDALELIISRRMENCGLIFISDGLFSRDVAHFRPDCRPTVFEVGTGIISADSPLHDLADPFGVDQSFDPRRIQMPYFEPEKRDKFFEKGIFKPLPMTHILGNLVPTIPELDIHGAAITYVKDDAELLAVRPKFIDPVLAYRRSGEGEVGVFTAGFTQEWVQHPEGHLAIQEWIERIVPYSARDRYVFKITDNGDEFNLRIEIHKDGTLLDIKHLSAQIEFATDSIPFSMQLVPGSPSTFEGTVRIPRTETTDRAMLVIEERGPDALVRPQRIPILIPMESPVDIGPPPTEALSYGLNENLLEDIADVSGGQYNPSDDFVFFGQLADVEEKQSYWPWLIALGALFYWLAIATHKSNILAI